MTTEQSTTSARIPAFDFTKGALVLFMVLYHWLNYFYGPQGAIYKYLRFLTPSFIFITGFLISHVHFPKYGTGSARLLRRLFLRGVKLLAIFIALNLLASLLIPELFVRNLFAGRSTLVGLDAVFFTARASGDGVGKVAAFGILVPISYLLMLAGLLSKVCKFFKFTFHAAGALLLTCMVFLDLHGIQSVNLELVTVGIVGVIFGYASDDKVQALMSRRWAMVFAYCVYVVAITIWDVSFYVQMLGACLTTALIYLVGVTRDGSGRLYGQITRLGRYSLFGYISQIAILQLLNAGLRHVDRGYAVLGTSFVAALALTLISVEAVDRGRKRSKALDGIYKTVFA